MPILYALVRLIFMGTIFILGMLLTLLLLLVPIRTARGMRLASLPIYWMDHLFLWTFNIQYHCSDPELLRRHQGMILCNHLSYVDPMIPSAITPIRFLGAAGVRRIPLVNLIALALDTIYVNRGSKTSRSQARQAVAQQLQSRPYPPLMLYPEGKISDGSQMFPFRHGAFEIVLEQNIPCLLCAVHYDPLSVVAYYEKDDNLPQAIWRLATYRGKISTELHVVGLLDQVAGDGQDAEALAEQAYSRIERSYETKDL